MTDQQCLLELERKFWTEGETFYRRSVDSECLMAFPQTAAVLSNPEIAASVRAGSRWRDVEIWPRGMIEPTKELCDHKLPCTRDPAGQRNVRRVGEHRLRQA